MGGISVRSVAPVNAADRINTSARVPVMWSAALAAGFLALYGALAPGVPGDGDSGEMMLVLATGGTSHPTGYPVYTVLGHAFSSALHTIGIGWALAANLWSALGAAVAIGLLHALAARLIALTLRLSRLKRFLLAALPVLLVGLNPLWVTAATQAEVYSWHFAWIAGATLACLSMIEAGDGPGGAGHDVVRSAAWGALCGLGLAHHLTSIFFILPLSIGIVVALARARRWNWRLPLAALGGAVIPLLSYGYVAYRAQHPAAFGWPLLEANSGSVVRHITGAEYRVYLGHFSPTVSQQKSLETAVYPFAIPGLLLLAALIIWPASRAHRGYLITLLAAAVLQALFVFAYGVPDPAVYLVPVMMVAMLSLSPALARLTARPGTALVAVVLLAITVGIGTFGVRSGLAERRRVTEVDRILRARWNSIPFEQGIVLWRNDFYTHLQAYQVLERQKPGIYVENPDELTWPPPRRAFQKRFGFDPVAGMRLERPEDVEQIPWNIRRQTRIPVLDFDTFLPWERVGD